MMVFLDFQEKRTYRTRYPLTGQMLLPPKKINDERATLVLDLDETLIHSKYDPQDPLSLTVKSGLDDIRSKA